MQKIKRGTFPFYKFCLGKTLISLNAVFSVAVNKVVTISALWSFQMLYRMYYNFLLTNITFIVLGLEKNLKHPNNLTTQNLLTIFIFFLFCPYKYIIF